MKKYIKRTCVLVSLALIMSCSRDYLVTNPTQSVADSEVFEDADGALVVLNGVYRSMYSMINHGNFGQKSYDLVSDLMGEDMVVHTQGYGWFNSDYNYSQPSNINPLQRPDRTWFYYYRIINNVNRIIDGLQNAQGTPEQIANIRGQALAMRAHSYYYLVNFFGYGGASGRGVPLYTSPQVEGNPRSSVGEIYTQIFTDLSEAATLLAGSNRVHQSHINQAVVYGIHARVALQYASLDQSYYQVAGNMAQQAISLSGLQLYTAGQYTSAAFNTLGAAEWMWGGQVIVDQATIFGSFYSHMDNRQAAGGYAALGGQKKITKALFDQIPDGDVRKTLFNTIPSESFPIYSQQKFQLRQAGNWASDYLYMRLSEMYLILSEAHARTGDSGSAVQTLQTLVSARFPGYDASQFSGNSLLDEILLQRKIELWGEGFSLFDLKRLGRGLNRPSGEGNHGGGNLNATGGTSTGNNFPPNIFTLPANTNTWLFAIPQDELNANNALTIADQNPQ